MQLGTQGGTVTRFEILGRVAARQDDWAADLPPQQQLLLAVLVMAGGATVGRKRLEEALWDAMEPYPEHGVEKAAYELRRALRRASPDGDPVPAGDGGYRLLVMPEQADVLRFYAHKNAARPKSGQEALEELQKALQAWGGLGRAGLHGGDLLLDLHGKDLRGQWADNTRHTLRTEYRKAVLCYLKQGMSLQAYDFVLDQCEQISPADPKALLDEEFTGLWMRAAACTGDLARAHTIFARATDVATRGGQQPANSLRLIDERLRADPTSAEKTAPTIPLEAVPLTTSLANEVSVMNELNPYGDASVGPSTGRQASPGPKVRSKVVIGQIADGGIVRQVIADPGPGDYETDGTIGVVGPQAQYTAVDLTKKK
jgi:DNA-binding SARP family transcriptional activator